MDITEVKYKIEGYVIANITRGLTEVDIQRYYKEKGYSVFTNYHSLILGKNVTGSKNLKKVRFKDETINLFLEYESGYPDFLLVDSRGQYKFVEVKLDNDCLRPNQIRFNNLLCEYEDVTIAYFNNAERLESQGFNKIKEYTKEQKTILLQLEKLAYVAKKKSFKPYWVIAKLHEKHGKSILNKKIIGVIANTLQLKADTIVWFVKTNLDK